MWTCAALLVVAAPTGLSQTTRPRSLLAPLPADPHAAQQLCSQLPGTARVYESEHFLIAHSMPTARVLELADHLEAVYRAWVGFAGQLELQIRRPAYKLNVLVFANFEDFCDYRQRHAITDSDVLGLYDTRSNLSIFFDLASYPPLRELRDRGAERTQKDPDATGAQTARFRQAAEALYAKVIRHEAAHHVQFATGAFCPQAKPPTWLLEGLAQLFEVASARHRATNLGNPYRLSEFRAIYDEPDELLAGLRRMVANGTEAQSAPHYPLSWALVSYLRARKHAEFAAYLRALGDCSSSSNALSVQKPPRFEDYFGPVDETLVTDLRNYLEKPTE